MSDQVDVVLFAGVTGGRPVQRMLDGARAAVALDTVEKALACEHVGRVIVATNSGELATALRSYPVTLEPTPPESTFHFGRHLAETIERHRIERPLYFGAGSAPLLRDEDLAELCRRLLAEEHVVVANNWFSADFVGFTPAAAIRRIDLPERDNTLAQLLIRQAALEDRSLPPSVGTTFDIDVPTDVMVLRLHPHAGRQARAYLESLDLNVERIERCLPVLVSQHQEVLIIGRVSTYIFEAMTRDLPCRKRVLAEERGMQAMGRDVRGEVRSLVGYYVEEVGARRFFERLPSLCDAAFFDTRVLFSHLQLDLTDSDRFYSDLGEPEMIEQAFAREFTAAALACAVPVILGGHSIVSGGLWALSEVAWLRNDAGHW